ncbi:MAG TPA: hypothetical protein ENG70_00805 [Candidatus Cloacimonetes bacterium]|nr:hypothetical protein [Candidatus Cloacimonadota bacterium]HEX37394.1 hypothetical protein [Candidatus Cloacimonadota bacterium]
MGQLLNTSETKSKRASTWLDSITNYFDDQGINYQSVSFTNGLTKDSTKTDIILSLDEISKSDIYSNISNIILISDGLHHNINNFILLDNYTIPVFPVLLGKYEEQPDIILEEVTVNNPVYLDTKTEIRITIRGIPENETFEITLLENNETLLTRLIKNEGNQKNYTLEFTPRKIGYRQLTARISVDNLREENVLNNQKNFLLNVVKNKAKITLITSSPNFDIAFIHRALQKNDRYELIFIDRRKNGYYHQNQPVQLGEIITTSDVLVLNNLDAFDFDAEIYRIIENFMARGGNIFYSGKIDKQLASLLPLQTSRFKDTIESTILETAAMNNYKSFSIQSLTTQSGFWNALPPITTYFYTPKPQAEVIAKADIASENPVIAFAKYLQGHVLQFSGYGFYKWKMWQKSEQQWFDGLILNIIQWLLNADVSQRFICSTNKLSYLEGEQVEFSAYLFDEKMNTVNNQDILVEIIRQDTTIEKKYMVEENGKYQLNIKDLIDGSYAYKAETTLGQRLYQFKGEFLIEDRTLEQSTRGIQKSYLEFIASKTGGSIINNVQELSNLDKIRQESIEFTSTIDFELWKQWYLPIFALLLLVIELIIRKKKGLL